MAYTAQLCTLRGEGYLLTIGGTGVGSGDLILSGDNPVVIQYSQDEIFKPLKMSSCSVTVLSSEPLLDLYTGKLNGVTLTVERGTISDAGVFSGGMLVWYGNLTPNVYSSGYRDVLDELTLEFVDPLSAMDNVKFRMWGDKFFATFGQYIQKALEKVGASDVVTNVVGMPSDMASVGCMQQNFRDEAMDGEDDAMTWKEVMEAIMLYLNRTAYVQGGTLYIVDAADGTGASKSMSEIGIGGSDGAISLGDVYNKVTVVANTYPVTSVFDEDVFDTSKYEVLKPTWWEQPGAYNETYKMYVGTTMIGEEQVTKMRRYFTYKGAWVVSGENKHSGTYNQGEDVYAHASGSYIGWEAGYKNAEGVPSSIDWSKSIVMQCSGYTEAQLIEAKEDCWIKYKSDRNTILKGGYLVLNISYKYLLPTIEYKGSYVGQWANTLGTGPVDDTWLLTLKIGNKYFNGEGWTTAASTFYVKHQWKKDDLMCDNEVSLDNTVSWEMSLSDSEDGVAIPLGDEAHFGAVELTINHPMMLGSAYEWKKGPQGTEDEAVGVLDCVHIKSLSLKWKTVSDNIVGLTENDDEDITYTGLMDENNIKEADDIEMRVNTYSSRQASCSYAIVKDGNDYDFYSPEMLPEKRCVKRFVEHYRQARLNITQTLKDVSGKHIGPMDLMTVGAFTGRLFRTGDVRYNLAEDTAEVVLMEF